MRQIYPDEGLLYWLQQMIVTSIKVHIFTNNLTPDRDTVLADMTEGSWTGYPTGGVQVNAADFTLQSVAGHVGSVLAAPVSFPNGSGGSVSGYGYYVTDSTVTKLLAVARFDSAPEVVDDGDSFLVIPIISDFSQFSS